MNLYVIEGGLGKHVIFSSLINKLYENNNEKISIMSAYPELFYFHPHVEQSIFYNEEFFYRKSLKSGKYDIICVDPYKSNFVFSNQHLAREWAKLYDVKIDNVYPDIYVSKKNFQHTFKICKSRSDFIIVQFSGGQSIRDSKEDYKVEGFIRNYPRDHAQKLVDNFKSKYPHIEILNFAHKNEPTYDLKGCHNISCTVQQLSCLLKFSLGFISIDSCLQHLASNRHDNIVGTVLWGGTRKQNYGYRRNYNLRNDVDFIDRPNHIMFEDRNLLMIHDNEKQYMNIHPDYVMIKVDEMIEFNTKQDKVNIKNVI